jgi:gamma-glutamyl-gamma-aminobutyrate hydrolase PuuD
MPHRRPLIGLNGRYESNTKHPIRDQIRTYVPYYQALLHTGALPVIVPTLDDRSALSEYLDRLDGFVFTGGLDLPPRAYGQAKHPRTQECDPKRFACDRLLAELALERDMPVLAICMGVQLLNVVYGGTLIQHIESEICHESKDGENDSFHAVVIEEESLLHRVMGTSEMEINSAHHQAVDQPAPGLRVAAKAPDGIVEAVQRTDRDFFLGVQWHPERFFDRPEQRQLFKALVNACQRGS